MAHLANVRLASLVELADFYRLSDCLVVESTDTDSLLLLFVPLAYNAIAHRLIDLI